MTITNVLQHIAQAKKVLVTGHVSPDGDSLGSTLGLYHLLRAQGLSVFPCCFDKIPAKYEYLPGIEAIQNSVPDSKLDALIIVDCGDLRRAGLPESLWHYPVINIDHHASNSNTLGTSWVDPSYSAVGQQVVHLAREAKWNIDSHAATCLYTSLATDTGFFRHANTTPELLRDAAELMELGADTRSVIENAAERKTMGELCLVRQALENLRQECDGQVTLIEMPIKAFSNCSADFDDAEGLVEYARGVPGTKVAALLRETNEKETKVSLRARGVDVSAVAVSFGGGGHKVAAGYTIEAPLSRAKELLLERLAEVLTHA